jgi:outer membrane protein assembly factor BamB
MLALALFLGSQLPGPPFRWRWGIAADQLGGEFAQKLGRIGSIEILTDDHAVCAVDLATNKIVWKKPLPGGVVTDVSSPPGSLYYATFTDRLGKQGTVAQVDPANGKTLQSVSVDFQGGGLVDDGFLYFFDGKGRFDALNLAKNQIVWSTLLGAGLSLSHPVGTPSVIVVDASGGPRQESQTMAFDRRTGKLKWRHGATSSMMDFAVYAGGTLITLENGLEGLDPETGRLIWKVDESEPCQTVVPVDGDLIFCFWRTVSRVDPSDGKIRWTYKLRGSHEFDMPIQALQVGDEILIGEMPTAAIGLDGREIWRTNEIEGDVLWANDRNIVTDDLGIIRSYEHGAPPTLPTTEAGRRAMAIHLVSRFDLLDNADKELLVRLGEPAFEPLLHATIFRAEALEKSNADRGEVSWDDTPGLLARVTMDREVPVMIHQIRSYRVNDAAGMMLLPALLSSHHGTEKELVTLCLWVVSKEKPTAFPGDESSIALSYLQLCSDGRAKRYVLHWDRAHPSRKPKRTVSPIS